MVDETKKLPATFYPSASSAQPVRDWLRSLSAEDRRVLGYDIGLAEIGWPIGMSLCRPLGGGVWEIRSTLAGNRIARVVFCIADGSMVLLHGLIRKSRTTPKSNLSLAHDRQKDLTR
jgi:phage-related protein